MKYFKYLSYVIRHKWFVMLACWKEGLYWEGLFHDLSKLMPGEFFPYANHFYGASSHHKDGTHAPQGIKTGRDETGYYKAGDTGDVAFDFAWLLHQKRNKHHWQWWLLPEDNGETKVFKMPLTCAREMVCDWRGAGRAQGTPDVLVWYGKNKGKMKLHPDTRKWVEKTIDFGT